MPNLTRLGVVTLLASHLSCRTVMADETDSDPSPDTITCESDEDLNRYVKYVEPFLTDAHPITCNECHLSGFDLGTFVRDTPCETMACIVSQGLVDAEQPEQSTIIAMVAEGVSESLLMGASAREREAEGILQWIAYYEACSDECSTIVDEPCAAGSADNPVPEGVLTPLGGCDEDQLVQAFETLVVPATTDCQGCHGTSQQGPPWFEDDGSSHANRRTMYNLLGLRTVDVRDPERSRLIAKPLASGTVADTVIGQVTGLPHGGGDVLSSGDVEVQAFAQWIAEYLACLGPDADSASATTSDLKYDKGHRHFEGLDSK